jgi:hypothetical protein
MKWGLRTPSISRSFSARISPKRYVRHNMGLKVPKGGGWFTSPSRAGYNRGYDRSTLSFWTVLKRLFR